MEITGTVTQSAGVSAQVYRATVPVSTIWGSITGTLANQTDLQTALNAKVNTSDYSPETKTSAMTQAVGKDSDGKLWTTPSSGGTWGSITGTLSNQTDLQTALDAKYTKPSTGIPSTDMTSAVQTSLGLADTALQSVPSTYRTSAAQDAIDALKQPITDNTLTTTDKTVPGAINELKSDLADKPEIDDTTTASTSVWSSSKVNTELGTKMNTPTEHTTTHTVEMITDSNYISKKTSATASHIPTFTSTGDIQDSNHSLADYIDKKTSATASHIPTFTSTGDIQDSNHSLADYIPYSDTSAMKTLMSNVVLDTNTFPALRIRSTVPSTSTDEGYVGEIAFDTDYLYICVASNSWKKIALSAI